MTDPKQAYLRSLVLERGLSANTAAAYGIDIDHLLSFARAQGLELGDITQTHLPSLPEIDAMIAAIDTSKDEALRNRTIIEVLYGSGLRVSELTGLRLSRLSLPDQCVIVEGKGSKQRLVPLSPVAVTLVEGSLANRASSRICSATNPSPPPRSTSTSTAPFSAASSSPTTPTSAPPPHLPLLPSRSRSVLELRSNFPHLKPRFPWTHSSYSAASTLCCATNTPTSTSSAPPKASTKQS